VTEEHPTPITSTVRDRVRRWDPDLATLHKAVRAAVLMPLVFVLGHVVLGNLQVALFAAFGSFALLVLTDVSGPPRARLEAFGALAVVGSVLVALGTLCARQTAVAAVAMAVVAFALLLAGAVSPLAAMTTTAALLAFILPVSIPAVGADLGARLAGWWLAVVVAVPAQLLIWPPRWHDRLREAMAGALVAVGQVLHVRSGSGSEPDADAVAAAIDQARVEVATLQFQFESTPFRPTTSAGRGLALAKLVDDLEWLRAASSADADRAAVDAAFCPDTTRQVWLAAAEVLERVPEVLRPSASRSATDDPGAATLLRSLHALRLARRTLSGELRDTFDQEALAGTAVGSGDAAPASGDLVDAVGASLNARRVANATELLGRHVLLAVGLTSSAAPTGRVDEQADERPEGEPDEPLEPVLAATPAAELESVATVRSVWFRTATRGAVGLALAVLVAKSFSIQHGFWVVLGTLSVLRSNAVGTGSSALRALLGTVAGFAIAAAVLAVIGRESVLLWVALPLAVFVATVAPTLLSFIAGQAAFTVVVVILFNLLDPTGWQVGLVRVQDVAIGCAISVVVGLLCWPRGASGVFGEALGSALSAGSGYLLAAVEVTTGVRPDVDLHAAHVDALVADRRLDDAFRLFLTERAVQRVGLDVANRLVAGATRIRLAAFSLDTLPTGAPADPAELPVALVDADAALCHRARQSHAWYQRATAALASPKGRLSEAPPPATDLRALVVAALDDARRRQRLDLVDHALRLVWAERHLARQSVLQQDLADQAEHLLSLR
jgi:hypothetical protein